MSKLRLLKENIIKAQIKKLTAESINYEYEMIMIKEYAYKKLIKDVDFFIKSNDIEYMLDSDWRARFLALLFPKVAKTLNWLIYSMQTLKNNLDYVENLHNKPEKRD